MNDTSRNNQLATIHMLAASLGYDRDTYELVNVALTGCRSSAHMTHAQRSLVIVTLQDFARGERAAARAVVPLGDTSDEACRALLG